MGRGLGEGRGIAMELRAGKRGEPQARGFDAKERQGSTNKRKESSSVRRLDTDRRLKGGGWEQKKV